MIIVYPGHIALTMRDVKFKVIGTHISLKGSAVFKNHNCWISVYFHHNICRVYISNIAFMERVTHKNRTICFYNSTYITLCLFHTFNRKNSFKGIIGLTTNNLSLFNNSLAYIEIKHFNHHSSTSAHRSSPCHPHKAAELVPLLQCRKLRYSLGRNRLTPSLPMASHRLHGVWWISPHSTTRWKMRIWFRMAHT